MVVDRVAPSLQYLVDQGLLHRAQRVVDSHDHLCIVGQTEADVRRRVEWIRIIL